MNRILLLTLLATGCASHTDDFVDDYEADVTALASRIDTHVDAVQAAVGIDDIATLEDELEDDFAGDADAVDDTLDKLDACEDRGDGTGPVQEATQAMGRIRNRIETHFQTQDSCTDLSDCQADETQLKEDVDAETDGMLQLRERMRERLRCREGSGAGS